MDERIPEVAGYSDDEIDEMAVASLPADERETVAAAAGQRGPAAGYRRSRSEPPRRGSATGSARARQRRADGAPVGTVGIGRDISQRKAYEQQLERQNERLDEFTSIVSHDLRNPLTVAEGNLELARAEYDSDALDKVSRAHERMRALIDDLWRCTRRRSAPASTSRSRTGMVDAIARPRT